MLNSLDWIFKKEYLDELTIDKNDKDQEYRFKTIWFMKDLTDSLRTPPQQIEEDYEYDMRDLRIFWTACVYFHRFYIFHKFHTHSRFPVAVACLFLASKVEEKQLRLVDHIYLYFKVRKNKQISRKNEEFIDMEKSVLLSERILLQTLNFDLTIAHPQQYFKQIIYKDIKAWFGDTEGSKQVIRLATTLTSDSFRTMLCLLYTPYQIALALVFLSLIILEYSPNPILSSSSSSYKSNTSLSNYQNTSPSVTWIEIFERDIDADILQSICNEVIELYKQNQNTFLPCTSISNEIMEHLSEEFSNKSHKKEIHQSSSIHSNISIHNANGTEEHKSTTIINNINNIYNTNNIYSEKYNQSSNNVIHRPPVPISDFTTSISSINTNNTNDNTNNITLTSSMLSLDKVHNYQTYSQSIHENSINNHTTNNITNNTDNNNDEIDDINSNNDIDDHDEIEDSDTPYEIPPPSDTPYTMGTCTPSFDYIPIITSMNDIHHLGKRTREEY